MIFDLVFPDAVVNICRKIQETAKFANLEVYLVGGSVRDLTLQRPLQDLDFVVKGEGNGIQLANLLHHQHQSSVPLAFPRYGTAMTTLDGYQCEFVHIDIHRSE